MSVLDAKQTKPFQGGPSFSLRNRLMRIAWSVAWMLLARWTPPMLHSWRALVLRAFGARIGKGVHVYPDVKIWSPRNLQMADSSTLGPGVVCYSMDLISVGRRAVVSQRAHLCAGTHNINDIEFQLETAPLLIGENAWIAAEAFVGPGVTVGEGAVLGARGVTVKDLKEWTVYAGNPARPVKTRESPIIKSSEDTAD